MKIKSSKEITTKRLKLRSWREADLEPFAVMNSNPKVMEFFPTVLTREESNALVDRIRAHFRQHGFGLWAVEIKDTQEFIGFTGLSIPRFEAHFTPCIEIGWRLGFPYWGKGYATEAAQAVLHCGFSEFELDEIVSFTTANNIRSRSVMEKLGMTRNQKDDFNHPNISSDHPLCPHVLYRIQKNN